MLRFYVNNNTPLTKDELMNLLRDNLGVPLDKHNGGLIRISPRSNENALAITIGKNRGITKDLFLDIDLNAARKANLTFTDAVVEPKASEEDDAEPVNNDENVVVDAEGNPV